MAKGQKRSTRELRKPKATQPKKTNAAATTFKFTGLGPKE